MIIDYYKMGYSVIPDDVTCTGKLQIWHVKKPSNDEPLLLDSIRVVHHDEHQNVPKGELGCQIKNFNLRPKLTKPVK